VGKYLDAQGGLCLFHGLDGKQLREHVPPFLGLAVRDIAKRGLILAERMIQGCVLVPPVLGVVDVEERIGGLEMKLRRRSASALTASGKRQNSLLRWAVREQQDLVASVSKEDLRLDRVAPTVDLVQFDQLVREGLCTLEIRLPQPSRSSQAGTREFC
jgi:hypothetical protein